MPKIRVGYTYLYTSRGEDVYRKHDTWGTKVRFCRDVEQKDGWDMCPVNPLLLSCGKCRKDLYRYSKAIGMLKESTPHEVCEGCEMVVYCHGCTKAREGRFRCPECRVRKKTVYAH